MALREYRCSNGHLNTEILHGEFPKSIPCPVCGATAEYVWSGGQRTVMDFRAGHDITSNRYFNSARERNNYYAQKNWQRVWG